MGEAMMKNCQTFFKVSGKYGEDPNETFPVEGLKSALKPYQAYAVYWMLVRGQTTNGLRGGFLCNDMGIGKTIEMLALIVISRWLRIVHEEVCLDRKLQGKKHLPSTNTDPAAQCPSVRSSPRLGLLQTRSVFATS